jgi:hypothetical protein
MGALRFFNFAALSGQGPQKLNSFPAFSCVALGALRLESGVSQHPIERFLSGGRVHPSTRARLLQAVQKLEREFKMKNTPEQ